MGGFDNKEIKKISENKYQSENNNLLRINPQFEHIISGNLSGSSHDRVVNSFIEMSNHDPVIRMEAFNRVISTGRLALPTLYAILLDDEVCNYVAAKTLGLKRKEMKEKLSDPIIQEKRDIRKTIVKTEAIIAISKITMSLDFDEKMKAVMVYQKVLLKEKNDDIIFNTLLSLNRLGDAALSLLPLINEMAKNTSLKQSIRNQALELIGKISEFSRNSANLLINILSNPEESIDIKLNTMSALKEASDNLSKEQSEEIIKIIMNESELNNDINFINRSIELLSSCGDKCLDTLISIIKEKNRNLNCRQIAAYACFGITKKDFNTEDYVLSYFVDIIKELEKEQEVIYKNLESDEYKIYNLLLDLSKKIAY